MSGIVSAIIGGVTAFAAITVAAVPEASHALEPLFAFIANTPSSLRL